MNESRFTKLERKELRKVAGLAYEREFATALELLEENFRQWRGNKITVFELSDFIHQFHNGIISKAKISPGVLEKLDIILLKMPQNEIGGKA